MLGSLLNNRWKNSSRAQTSESTPSACLMQSKGRNILPPAGVGTKMLPEHDKDPLDFMRFSKGSLSFAILFWNHKYAESTP
jgi:hypothetical protein